MKLVNYKELKERIRIDQVLAHYGLLEQLKTKGENLIGTCPIHKGTNPRQFHVSLAKNNFNCFGNCHDGGNVIDFVVMMEGGSKENQEDVRAAAMRLQEWFGLEFERPRGGRHTATASVPAMAMASVVTTGLAEDHPAASQLVLPLATSPESRTPAPEPGQVALTSEVNTEKDPSSLPVGHTSETTPEVAKVNPPLKFALKSLDPDHAYLKERGLTPETIAAFGVGMCTGKGIMAGRIAIPIHNELGELVAYAGRWPGVPPEGEGKYKLPTGFHKSLVVYNLHRAREHANSQGLIVVEGFFDAMRLWQAGFPNVVALMGSSLSEAQERLILESVGPGGKVTLMFDEDEAGWKGREDALSRLSSGLYVKVIGLGEEGTQPDGLGEEQIRTLLA